MAKLSIGEQLTKAIEAKDEKSVAEFATAESITLEHLILAQKLASKVAHEERPAYRIYQNLLDRANNTVLEQASNRGSKFTRQHDKLATDVQATITERKLLQAIEVSALSFVDLYTKAIDIKPKYLKLAAKKYEEEVDAPGKTSGKAGQVFKMLVERTPRQLMKELKDDPELGAHAKAFLENVLNPTQKSKKPHPLDVIQSRPYAGFPSI